MSLFYFCLYIHIVSLSLILLYMPLPFTFLSTSISCTPSPLRFVSLTSCSFFCLLAGDSSILFPSWFVKRKHNKEKMSVCPSGRAEFGGHAEEASDPGAGGGGLRRHRPPAVQHQPGPGGRRAPRQVRGGHGSKVKGFHVRSIFSAVPESFLHFVQGQRNIKLKEEYTRNKSMNGGEGRNRKWE